MKKELKLIPLKGFELENKNLKFGQSVEEIKEILGEPSHEEEAQLFYHELEIRLDFNNNKFEYLEIQGPVCEFINPIIYNINPFNLEAEKLHDLLEKENNGKIENFESPYSYCFIEISVGIWRGATPRDIEETIEEAKKNEEYEEAKDVFNADLNKSKYFWTIGIGAKDYYEGL